MAYDTAELERQILEVIEKEELTFFSEISLFIPASERTLYNKEMQEMQSIKEALEANKIRHKSKMRKKWRDSENATLQISAYKLLADDEELKKLTMNKVEASGPNGTPIQSESKHVVEFHNYANQAKV
jgi:hypothetical protein